MSETSKFTEDILTAAREKAQAIVSEAEVETKKALEEARAHSTREAESVVGNARAEAASVKRRQTSEVRHRIKLHEQQERDKVLAEVLSQTRKLVGDFAKDEAKYTPFLSVLVESGIREIQLDPVVLHMNSSDLKRIDKSKLERDVGKRLGKSVKMEFSQEPIEALGGAIISSTDGKTRIVNTLDQRFEALEAKLLVQAGKILFTK